jgi:hypothetical protein
MLVDRWQSLWRIIGKAYGGLLAKLMVDYWQSYGEVFAKRMPGEWGVATPLSSCNSEGAIEWVSVSGSKKRD